MSKKYSLTDSQIKDLAIICYRQQGTNNAGVRACASHMCNYYEKWQIKKYSNPYDCTMKSGWYWSESKNKTWIKHNPSVPQSIIDAVKDVIVNGNRNIPDYVDEYDCLSDVASISNNGKIYKGSDVKKRNLYIKDVTKITNIYGSNYTFYCFPDGVNGYCDAFGYISKPATQQKTTSSNTTTIPDAACTWAESIAANQTHGYSQANRWGPDYDCSSLVISSYIKAGVPIDKNKVYYTGNMNGLKNYGFIDVTKNINLNTGSGLLRGDILYYHISGTNGHTAMYCGNGKIVHARGQSYGSSATGDQGTEIAVTTYARSKWQYVLRYNKNTTTTIPTTTSPSKPTSNETLYKKGSVGTKVKEIQQQLNKIGNYKLEEDGEFGSLTEKAVIDFQKKNNLQVDGIVGKQTLNKLAELVKKNNQPSSNQNITYSAPSKTVKYKGKVTAMYLNVRSGPGKEYNNIKSYPILSQNTVIQVCDTLKAKDNSDWLYICINKQIYGFVSTLYIQKI